MSEPTEAKPNAAEPKEWTLMFFFASDNALAPGVVGQLKAVKNAGYHHQVNVVAQFDPRTIGTPTHIFDVNLINKIKDPGNKVGFQGNDPFVRNVLEDKLWRDEKSRDGTPIRNLIAKFLKEENQQYCYDPPFPPDGPDNCEPPHDPKSHVEPSPKESLWNFLKFCADNYPAKHYALFILGHGVVVGNDIFLFDEHAAESSMSLIQLGEVLRCFKQRIRKHQAEFELVSFHSCSVSSVEVAFELQGTANFMLASQGPAFVGSWPYRQLIIRLMNDVGKAVPVKDSLTNIFWFTLYNSTDFLMAGYSFDVCLCDLNKIEQLAQPLKDLSVALRGGLHDPLLQRAILLAHWRSQSYWQESYTDIYDLCFCLKRALENSEEYEWHYGMQNIIQCCKNVMCALEKEHSPASKDCPQDRWPVQNGEICDALIVATAFAGPAYQYSHGLSIFLPWSKPASDVPIMEQYRQYRFSQATSWFSFLEAYFDLTMRDTLRTENGEMSPAHTGKPELIEDIASLMFNPDGALSRFAEIGGPKTDPSDPTGDECECPSIKNFPHDTRARGQRTAQAAPHGLPMSQAFLEKILMD